MKKFTITLVALSFAFSIQAQPARVGFAAGLNYSSFATKGDLEGDFKPGLAAGLITEIEFGQFCVAPALYYSQKGDMWKDSENGTKIKERLNLNYIELDLNFLYKAKPGMNSWFIGAGPYIATAIESVYRVEIDKKRESGSIRFGTSEDDDLRGLDAGINLLAGYRWSNGLYISANYTRGLYNLQPVYDNGPKVFNQAFGLKLGYFFKGLKD